VCVLTGNGLKDPTPRSRRASRPTWSSDIEARCSPNSRKSLCGEIWLSPRSISADDGLAALCLIAKADWSRMQSCGVGPHERMGDVKQYQFSSCIARKAGGQPSKSIGAVDRSRQWPR